MLRADAALEQAGGKGVNISRAATVAGRPDRRGVPRRAPTPPSSLALRHDGIRCRPRGADRRRPGQPHPHRARRHHHQDQQRRRRGRRRPARPAARRGERARRADADWVVLAGSVPPGTPDGWYAEVAAALQRLRRAGRGGHLRQAAARPGRGPGPGPSRHHQAQLRGAGPAHRRRRRRPSSATRPPRPPRRTGSSRPGPAPCWPPWAAPAPCSSPPTGAWHATPPPITVVSTVGAGDSSLFGYLLADLRGEDPAERLRLAVAYGSAAASLPGTTIPAPHQVRPDLVEVHPVPLDNRPAPASTASLRRQPPQHRSTAAPRELR